MASSVASGKEMEKWGREEKQKVQTRIEMPAAASRNFSAGIVDYDQLEKFETRAQRLAERQEAKEHELEVVPVINVMGSTAGAGSGDFHMYRGYRAKEMHRLKVMETEKRQEEENAAWQAERDAALAADDAKTSKKAAKRAAKKEKRRADADAEKAAKAARRAEAAGEQEGEAAGEGEGGGEGAATPAT